MAQKKPLSGEKYIKVNRKVADKLFARFEIGLARALLAADADHVRALEMLAGALCRTGRHDETLEVDLRLTRLMPGNAQAFYNLACSYSNSCCIDEALCALSKALNLGFRDFNYMMTDGDLENVRRDPRFKRLLDRKWGKRQP
ncbi:MAG: hypothetical protein HYY16_07215 [Planctomycetes bacterium]|nr:hypothetical protein [Planctomycetota bacterium]